MKKFFTLLLTICGICSFAQSGFERVYGLSDIEVFNAIMPTSDGGVLACGSTGSFDPLYTDGYVVKTDGNGDTLWTKWFGTANVEEANAVLENAAGYLVAGTNVPVAPVSYDMYLVQYDVAGNIIWEKFYGGTGVEACYDAVAVSNQQTILAGYSTTYTFSFTDSYIIRTDGSGNQLDDAHFGGAGNEAVNGVVATSDGGFAMIGYSNSTDPNYNIYVVKCDSDLNLVWSKEFGTAVEEIGFDIEEDASGNLWLLGIKAVSADSSFMMLIKTDASGENPVTYFPGAHPGSFGYRILRLPNDEFLISGYTGVPGKGSEVLLEKIK